MAIVVLLLVFSVVQRTVGNSSGSASPDMRKSVLPIVMLSCWPKDVPLGALPGQPQPVWCYPRLASGPSTFSQASNSWVDDFNHGLTLANIGSGYKVFDRARGINQSLHWRHANHWMVDVNGKDTTPADYIPRNYGGAMLRPDRSFKFEAGVLVIEADVAAGISEYQVDTWPEIDITTAPGPTATEADNLYGYGQFAGQFSLGCRRQSTRVPICAFYYPSGERRWEISFFQPAGAVVYGGEPGPPGGERDRAWRVCQNADPDLNCRDRFRIELRKDSVVLFVNGTKYMSHTQFPASNQLPDEFMNNELYVYLSSWIYKLQHNTVRFHWDRLAVNPGTPPSSAISSTHHH
jgi:hypothetical protein